MINADDEEEAWKKEFEAEAKKKKSLVITKEGMEFVEEKEEAERQANAKEWQEELEAQADEARAKHEKTEHQKETKKEKEIKTAERVVEIIEPEAAPVIEVAEAIRAKPPKPKKERKMTSNTSNGSAAMLFVLVWLLHLTDLMFGRLAGNTSSSLFAFLLVAYALITLYAVRILGKESLKECVIVSIIAMGLPYFVSLLVKLMPMIPKETFSAVLIVAPFWFLYLLFWQSDKLPKWLRRAGYAYFFLWIVIFIMPYLPAMKQAMIEITPQIETDWIQPGKAVSVAWDKAKAGAYNLWNETSAYKTQKLEELQALGFYEGQVDSKSKEQLGVYFGELKSLKQEYASGEFVDIFTTLSAQTLDKPLDISLSCEGPGIVAGERVAGEITPESQLHVEMFDQPNIDCMIKQGFVVGKGLSESKTITLSADFKFSTMSYLRSYFMELEKLRTLRRMSIEPLSQYGITDKNPKAVSTSGPVLIGMSLGESLPIGIDSKGNQILTLGITLSNKWTGKLENITKIVLVLPKGIVLSSILPVTSFMAGDCSGIEGCDAKTQNVYIINGVSLPFEEASYTTIRALLKVESPGSLLGVAPLAIKSVWAIADYDYTLQKAKTITVRGPS